MTTASPTRRPSDRTNGAGGSSAVLCLSVLLVAIDNTIVNVALPTISRELSATTSQLQWVVDAYTLVFAGLLLVGGQPRRPARPAPHAAGRAGRCSR